MKHTPIPIMKRVLRTVRNIRPVLNRRPRVTLRMRAEKPQPPTKQANKCTGNPEEPKSKLDYYGIGGMALAYVGLGYAFLTKVAEYETMSST